MNSSDTLVEVKNLQIGYENHIVQNNLDFSIQDGDIFFIIGASGSGKTTLLKSMIGLLPPLTGTVEYAGVSFYDAKVEDRLKLLVSWGITFQSGALISAMTLAENVALPLRQYTSLTGKQIEELVDYKLSLVGLAGYQNFYPAELSGGMHKRAGLARALALDPKLLFFDEPSAGLDPLSSARLDELIVQLCEALGATAIIVSHELPSILSIGTNMVFLDTESKTMLDVGDPKVLRKNSRHEIVRQFMTRSVFE